MAPQAAMAASTVLASRAPRRPSVRCKRAFASSTSRTPAPLAAFAAAPMSVMDAVSARLESMAAVVKWTCSELGLRPTSSARSSTLRQW